MKHELTTELAERGKAAVRLGLLVLCLSTLGYYLAGCWIGMNARYDKSLWSLSDDQWDLTECFYAAAITVTTVGYTDLLGTEGCIVYEDGKGGFRWDSATDSHETAGYDRASETLYVDYSPWTRMVTAAQVIVGMAFFLYVIAQGTSFFVERGHEHLARSLRTRRQIARLREHVVICGAGEAAQHMLDGLRADGVDCVVIEEDLAVARQVHARHTDVPVLVGDARDEEALVEAQIDRAVTLVTMLPEDRLNLVTVVTARQLCDGLRIVTRGVDRDSPRRLAAAGANTVIRIDALVGLRVASELIRPSVVDFLDLVIRPRRDNALHFEGVRVGEACDSMTLADIDVRRRAQVQIVGIVRSDQEALHYNPTATDVVRKDDELVLLGGPAEAQRLRDVLREPPSGPAAKATFTGFLPDVEDEPEGEAEPEPITAAPGDLDRHYIICGLGDVGLDVVREVSASGRSFVVIENDQERIDALKEEIPSLLVLQGDCQDPDMLAKAGLMRAHGVAAVLADDRANLVVAVTALQANPRLRVVSVAREARMKGRLERAGARVVPGGEIGGSHVAANVLRPRSTTFLDRMRDVVGGIRFEGVEVTATSSLANLPLSNSKIYQRTAMRVVAIRTPDDKRFIPHPEPDHRMVPGTVLIVVGSTSQVRRLVGFAGEWE